MAITEAKLKNAKTKKKKYALSIGKSLYLVITPSGTKSWKYRFLLNNKSGDYTIGEYPLISLDDAIDKAKELRVIVKSGQRPKQYYEKILEKKVREETTTFQVVAEQWLKIKAFQWSPTHLEKVTRTLELNVYPYLGDELIAEIYPQDILIVLRKIEARGAFELTSKIHQRIRSVFSLAVIESMIRTNPAQDLNLVLIKPKSQNYPHVTIKELPDLLNSIDCYEGDQVTVLGLNLLALTFLRSRELRSLQWSDVSEDGMLLEVPAEHMKMKVVHVVPLSSHSRHILSLLKPLTGHSKYLFPQRNAYKIMSENTLLFALYRMGYKHRMSVHGFRHVASTALNEMGYRADLIEKQLAHGDANKIRAVYNKAKYLPERMEMMEDWGNFIDSMKAKRPN